MRPYNDLTMTKSELNKLIALENANFIELVKIVNAVIGDGSPKGVFPTVFALKSKYPNGAKGIYVVSENGHWYYWNGQWSDGGAYLDIPNPLSGTTAQRPTNNRLTGMQYFDTTLNKPIWYNGFEWIDATGATV